ncbi:MAG: Rieske 2Fe-2S domain-containing protein [Verrucomicrobia bacterium]|nr:Rieske 2Fe-2S domain-containing protein [Verrucomicrobiota bacterium]
MIKDVLEGKPFKHPLHPMLVHFPIALFAISFLLDIASLATSGEHGFVRASFYSMALGVVTALLASIAGLVDYTSIREDHPAKNYATAHMLINLGVIGLYALNLGLRYSAMGEIKVGWPPFLISVLAIIMLSVSGYLGGAMVYDDGIGVGRHRRKTPTPQTTISTSSTEHGTNDSFLPVADADTLDEHETLRVNANGTVLVITKLDGQFYAFQEFCPHRFGPLSEGAFCDGEIECPWHRSRFDIRTGEVTSGPAKIGLKTFPVQMRSGKIFVSVPAE